jgi:hypothetical protein
MDRVAREQWHLMLEWPEQIWYTSPQLVVTMFSPEITPYAVAVELRRDEDGSAYVIGVAVRRHAYNGWDGERTDVSPREIQRLPLSRIVRAALAAAAKAPLERPPPPQPSRPGETIIPLNIPGYGKLYYDNDEKSESLGLPVKPAWAGDARRILVPRGQPRPGKSTEFYKGIAESYRQFAQAGMSPVKEIARRKRKSENTVHQWVHRARKLGFLEPSTRSRSRELSSDRGAVRDEGRRP